MGVVSVSQERKLTNRVFIPIREFLVDSRAVRINLIAYTVFSLTLSFLPATQPVFNSFWQHPLVISVGIIASLALGKPFRQLLPAAAANTIICKEITERRRKEKT
jgi:hypothetical protein